MSGKYQRKRDQQEDRNWAVNLIAQAQLSNWYGQMTFVFENGELKRARKDESLIPPPKSSARKGL